MIKTIFGAGFPPTRNTPNYTFDMVQTVELVENLLSENQFCSGVYLEGGMLLAPHKGFWVNFISCKDDDIDEKKAAIYDQESLFLPA